MTRPLSTASAFTPSPSSCSSSVTVVAVAGLSLSADFHRQPDLLPSPLSADSVHLTPSPSAPLLPQRHQPQHLVLRQYQYPSAAQLSPLQPQPQSQSQFQSLESLVTVEQSLPPSVLMQHRRVYQACIPCRRRKVRCDLGSVDNPCDPPCLRCRRESKECFFSATRRKRRADDLDEPALFNGSGPGPEDDFDNHDYTQRNSRKRIHRSSSPPSFDRHLFNDLPLTSLAPLSAGATATASHGKHHALAPKSAPLLEYSTGTSACSSPADRPNAHADIPEAQIVMRREAYGPLDALDMLCVAATDTPALAHSRSPSSVSTLPLTSPRQGLSLGSHKLLSTNAGAAAITDANAAAQSRGSGLGSGAGAGVAFGAVAAAVTDGSGEGGSDAHARFSSTANGGQVKKEVLMDPELASPEQMEADPGYNDAIKAWTRFRFVRAGWFTAVEAMGYIDYYYRHLSPLTPISPPTFWNPSSHTTLLTDEPLLTVTLLTIASRYKQLSGPGGKSRSYAIHEQLWNFLRGMIERCLWGQEAFSGGIFPTAFAGAGDDRHRNGSTEPSRGLRRGSLRTLGTIESLMILTEWHPRALHFPPTEAIPELLVPAADQIAEVTGLDATVLPNDSDNVAAAAGAQRYQFDHWMEPAWRSDRMCWMLLSAALGLAYELGVFDDVDELVRTDAISRPEYEDEAYRQRAHRIKRLLMIYLTQLAGRLGWTNMVPENLRQLDLMAWPRRRVSVDVTSPSTSANPSVVSTGFNYIPNLEMDDQVIHCWAGISNAMHIGNLKLFKSRKHTTEIIKNGRYTELMRELQPMLKTWRREFERFRLPIFIRHILTIEFEYVRIFINSLSLQAVVERCCSQAGAGSGPGAGYSLSLQQLDGGELSAQHLSLKTQHFYGKLPLGHVGGFLAADREYVQEVLDASRSLLRTVVEGLLPGDFLKHAPVRTYFRIISASMFLLKSFALGAPPSDVKVCMDLIDATVEGLRTCVVDDVHLGNRFADMLETLTNRLRNRFIQAPLPPSSAVPPAPISLAPLLRPAPPLSMTMPPAAAPAPIKAVAGTLDHHQLDQVMVNGLAWPSNAGNHLDKAGLGMPPSVSATPFDTSLIGAFGGTANPLDTDDWAGAGEMWYLPTGSAFFQELGHNSVMMTAEGVNVGGIDMLDFMTMDQAHQFQMPGYP